MTGCYYRRVGTDGEYVVFDSTGCSDPAGIGVTTAELFDRAGSIGTSAQTLLVQRRVR